MAVQEVGVPSGFEIDKDTLKSATAIKRTETQDSKLVLYFDEVSACLAVELPSLLLDLV